MNNRKGIGVLFADLLGIGISYLVASVIRYSSITSDWYASLYGYNLPIVLLIYVLVFFVFMDNRDYYKRSYIVEFREVVKCIAITALLHNAVLFVKQTSYLYSRFVLIVCYILSIWVVLLLRLIYKDFHYLIVRRENVGSNIVVIAMKNNVHKTLAKLAEIKEYGYTIKGLVIIDQNMMGKSIAHTKVIANKDTVFDYVKKEAIDEVFISVPDCEKAELENMIYAFESMGIMVNISINTFNLHVKEKVVKNFGNYHVLTFSTRVFEPMSLFRKRMIDVIGSLLGLCITGVITLFVAPAIRIESKGPIFFSQERVGKNGRRFKIYKFRSMYQDAEEKKKELMDQNEMEGLMFKMTNDPRITKVGKFLRKTSLDELPQFYNVLKGDMSLVGTRPPTVDEFNEYELRHKRRLSLTPGLTGLWQVSGRSDIVDFEEVVKLDLEYIDNWSIGLDMKIMLKTFVVVFCGRGSK